MLLTARRLPVYPSGLQPQHYCNLVTTVLPRAPRAIRPHLEREVLPLGGHEAQLLEERGLAGERQHLGEAVRRASASNASSSARPMPEPCQSARTARPATSASATEYTLSEPHPTIAPPSRSASATTYSLMCRHKS